MRWMAWDGCARVQGSNWKYLWRSKHTSPKIHTYFPLFKYLVSGWKPSIFLFISTYTTEIQKNLIPSFSMLRKQQKAEHPGKGQGVRRMLTHRASSAEGTKAFPVAASSLSLKGDVKRLHLVLVRSQVPPVISIRNTCSDTSCFQPSWQLLPICISKRN